MPRKSWVEISTSASTAKPKCYTGILMNEWDIFYLGLAKYVASKSKDPSTQCGAVIVDAKKAVVSLGFNGFPIGVEDSADRYNDRDTKLKIVIHAEANAIVFAKADLSGCKIYTYPFLSCSTCAGLIIQSGIKHIVSPVCPPDKLARWADSFKLSTQLYTEAGVQVELIEFE